MIRFTVRFGSLPSPRISRFALLFFSGWTAFGQPVGPSFGPRIDFKPDFVPSTVAVRRLPDSNERIVLASASRSGRVGHFRIDGSGSVNQIDVTEIPSPVTRMQWLDRGESTEGVFLSGKKRTFTRVTSTSTQTETLAVEFDRFLAADLDNDNRIDLLFYGRQATGIAAYFSSPRGGVKGPVTLLPDLSASDLVATDLNGDSITDLFVADWLGNRLVLYLGIGRGYFSEQIAFPLPGEPDELAFSSLENRMRMAVSIPESQEVLVLSVSPIGEIRIQSRLPSVRNPVGLALSDVNNDLYEDVVTASGRELLVFIGDRRRSAFLRSSFSAPGPIVDWELADIDADGQPDAVLATSNPPRLSILGNHNHSGRVSWPPRYSVGAAPGALTTGDFNGDGLPDVAVVSSESGSCALLLNQGEGRFSGQLFVPIDPKPYAIRLVSGRNPNRPAFLVSHESLSQVSVVRPFATDRQDQLFSIPTAPNPYVMSAAAKSGANLFDFLARNAGQTGEGYTVSLFEQISADQFIETTIRPNTPSRITSITSSDFTRDGAQDILFTTFEPTQAKTFVQIARAVGPTAFQPAEVLASFTDSAGVAGYLRVHDLDRDGRSDIVASFPPPVAGLMILFGGKGGTSVDTIRWVPNVAVPGEDAVTITDLNGDGRLDLCLADSLSKNILLFPGAAQRRFGQRQSVTSADGVTSVAVGAFASSSSRDLVMSNRKRGTVSFLFNPQVK